MTVKEAIKILKKGGVIAYPTETFYGLGVDPKNKRAIEKIFKIKKRERGKPISLIVSSKRQLTRWATGIGDREWKLIKNFWPGPLTLIFRAKKSVSTLLTAGTGKIGIRVSPEGYALKLARGIGGAITATSANLSGQSSCLSFQSVQRKIGTRIDGVVSRKILKKSNGSTILDISDSKSKVLREGEISHQEIETVLNQLNPEGV